MVALQRNWRRAIHISIIFALGQYFEGFNLEGKESTLPVGVYSLDDLKEYGRMRNWCPYFLARHAVRNLQ